MTAIVTRSVPDMLRLLATSGAKAGAPHDYSRQIIERTSEMSQIWIAAGCQRFRLTDSLAALFRLTTAPVIDAQQMPHMGILIEVPGRYLRIERFCGLDASTAWVLVASDGASIGVAVFPDGNTEPTLTGTSAGWLDPEECDMRMWVKAPKRSAAIHAAARFAGNLIAYLHEFPSAAKSERAGKIGTPVAVVSHPRNVVVSREMRDAAVSCAASSNVAAIRRAMAHHVRGHWRNQACGEGRADRRRTWIHPHRRGAESLGRVVERITKIC
jgi:hypothetical protein